MLSLALRNCHALRNVFSANQEEHSKQRGVLEKIIEKSQKFPIKFPINSVRCMSLKDKFPAELLEKNIDSAYPVLHEKPLVLYASFLQHQRKFGHKRDFYRNLTLLDFVDRLLTKRAVIFVGVADHYVLLDSTTGSGNWESIGTSEENPPLILENCLSYDEIKLSVFLSVSSKTVFINDGKRRNLGIFDEKRTDIEENGVIIGLIGPRLTKPKAMEYREIVKSRDQNNHNYGYGQSFLPTLQGHFLNFYGDISATYEDLERQNVLNDPNRFIDLGADRYFDKMVYRKRLQFSFDTLLIEANQRGIDEDKSVYVHVVGIGLGVWKLVNQQNEIFLETLIERIT